MGLKGPSGGMSVSRRPVGWEGKQESEAKNRKPNLEAKFGDQRETEWGNRMLEGPHFGTHCLFRDAFVAGSKGLRPLLFFGRWPPADLVSQWVPGGCLVHSGGFRVGFI